MIDWVRVVTIPALAAIAAIFISLAIFAALGPNSRRSSRRLRTITKVVEAPEDPRMYLAFGMDRLTQLYQQTPGAAFTKEREDEVETTAAGGVGVPHVKANYGRKARTTERIVPNEVSLPQKAAAVERYLLSGDRAHSFDLIAPGDERPISDLLMTLRVEAGRIGLVVPSTVTAELEKAWKEKIRSAPAPDFRSLGPFVRIRAEFLVKPGEVEGDRRLVASVWDRGAQSAQVVVLVRKSDLVSPNGDLDELSRTIRATCLGQQQWRAESDTLELSPISVYIS